MIMSIIFVEPVGIPLISSVLCEPKKNYKIGLTVYHKKKKRWKDRVAAISMLPKQMSFILIYPPFRCANFARPA